MSVEQQINPKFLVRLEKTPTEALKLLQEVYGDDTMSRTRPFERHRRFKEEREKVEDDHKSGRPSTSRTVENVDGVRQKVWSDHRLTVGMIADELGMNSERIIIEDLGMMKICAKMVPEWLNKKQRERCVQVCQDISEQLETELNLLKVLLLAMSHGSSSTIHSPNGRALNGRCIVTKAQKGEGVHCSSPKPR